jgi:phosphatidylserine/phosphatidylglycerophosphate/cardiolipin synthase-like enzyme
MARSLRPAGILAALAVVAATLAASPTADAVSTSRPVVTTESHDAARTTPQGQGPAARRLPPYSPSPGVIFNDANGSNGARNRILNKIVASIRHAPPGSTIRVVTWSYFYGRGTDALIAAHKRGVSVRLVMALAKSKESHDYKRLRRALGSYGNKKRPYALKSGVKACRATCRGHAGTMHAKMFMFSRAGKAKNVVMWGSPNLTRASARLQWNDLYTSVNRVPIFDYAIKIFNEMWRDKPVAGPYEIVRSGPIGLAVLPYRGTGDWISNELSKVRCQGATGGTGYDGRTTILVAQAVIRGTIGNRIARLLKQRWDEGCRVRILYTIRGVETRKILMGSGGRGAVPMRHYVQDLNGDGLYDKYLHMKALVVSGVMGDRTNARFVMNGSENWADLARLSDEEVGYFEGEYFTRRYSNWINWLWNHVPKSVPLTVTARRMPPKDPYANLELD